MIINPLQIGPCTLDEAAVLMGGLARASDELGAVPASADEAAAILEGRAKALGEDRELQSQAAQRRALIRAAFEGPQALPALANPFESLAGAHEREAPEALELPYRRAAFDGDMEAIALYLPRAAHGERRGIYLHARRMLELARSRGLDLAGAVVPLVSVHELFHAYIEETMAPAAYSSHRDNPCLWEEAAANRAAADWCASSGMDQGSAGAALMAALLRTRDKGGLPGYGDWPLVSRDYPAVIPRAIAAGRCAKTVNHGDWVLAVGEIMLMEREERQAALRGLDLWAGMLSRFIRAGERVVPVYVDLLPWET